MQKRLGRNRLKRAGRRAFAHTADAVENEDVRSGHWISLLAWQTEYPFIDGNAFSVNEGFGKASLAGSVDTLIARLTRLSLRELEPTMRLLVKKLILVAIAAFSRTGCADDNHPTQPPNQSIYQLSLEGGGG